MASIGATCLHSSSGGIAVMGRGFDARAERRRTAAQSLMPLPDLPQLASDTASAVVPSEFMPTTEIRSPPSYLCTGETSSPCQTPKFIGLLGDGLAETEALEALRDEGGGDGDERGGAKECEDELEDIMDCLLEARAPDAMDEERLALREADTFLSCLPGNWLIIVVLPP